MAITAITTPSAPTLAYQPIIFKLESDEATIVNLIVEVFRLQFQKMVVLLHLE